MKPKTSRIITFSALALCFIAMAVFYFVPIAFTGDKTADPMLSDTLTRLFAAAAAALLAAYMGSAYIFTLPRRKTLKDFFKDFLWCVPVFLVILANFPFSALISGKAVVSRPDLIWLLILKCIGIGLLEEILFRGIVLEFIMLRFKDHKNRIVVSVLAASLVFGLIHLVNLFYGGGVVGTIQQIGYSFLIGAMLSAVLLKTGNLWLCVALHAAFDFGGMLVADLGEGAFQDTVFWILTAAAGVICIVSVAFTLLKMKTCRVYERDAARAAEDAAGGGSL